MSNDLVNLAMKQASDAFGGRDGTFNLAGLSGALCRIANVRGPIDGCVLRVFLLGRTDCVPLEGGAHYRLVVGKEGG